MQWHSHDFSTGMHNFLNPPLCVLTVPNLFFVVVVEVMLYMCKLKHYALAYE